MRAGEVIFAFLIAVACASTLFAQSRNGQATAQLTVSATVVPSVMVVVPREGNPEVAVANAADGADTFGKIRKVQVTRARKARAETAPGPAIVYRLDVHEDRISRMEEVHAITDSAGRSAVLETTTIVLK
jgi:hypothetical protein